jgi:hypothetical protein
LHLRIRSSTPGKNRWLWQSLDQDVMRISGPLHRPEAEAFRRRENRNPPRFLSLGIHHPHTQGGDESPQSTTHAADVVKDSNLVALRTQAIHVVRIGRIAALEIRPLRAGTMHI